ncbi:uncharacterized protein LOC128734095 [Sabethes cyaneus]|uniref:uncharacterized protein LOC128734095 n=1 Tax=Sabethes cyaneus TaxID=53552 RepID=UPI00237DFBDA|nr:uncharacterized protein LOC128734095 [Sabethes cyaneus]
MGKLQNKSLLTVIVVISTIGCHAFQQSPASDYSENQSQHPEKRLVHRHHGHQHQHRLNTISLGTRNSSRYSLIGPFGAGNHYQPQPTDSYHQHHHHHRQPAAGSTVSHHQHAGFPSISEANQENRRYHNPGLRWNTVPTERATTTARVPSNRPGNNAGGRSVRRMLKNNNHHHRNITGKNICTEKRIVHVPVYKKSTVKHFVQPCPDQTLCSGFRANYEPTYHTVKKEVYVCCQGWETATTISEGCFKPVCKSQCRNGGTCTAPDTCTCTVGFTGAQCEQDINECKIEKPCDQTCYNTDGSYYCTCRDGFMLQPDRQSCKRIETANDVATEARDMENDVDYDSLDTRLSKLEKIIYSEDRRSQSENHELNKKVQYALDAVSSLRSQISRLSQRLYPSVDYGNRIN